MNTNGSDKVVKKGIDELEEIIKKQEERIHNLETKALHLTNLYFVFQGVILSTVAAKKLECGHAWVPFTLSLVAALLNTAALCHTIYSFVRCSEELDQNREDVKVIMEDKQRKGNQENGGQLIARRRPDSITQRIRITCSLLCIFCFLGFSGVILYGCFGILC